MTLANARNDIKGVIRDPWVQGVTFSSTPLVCKVKICETPSKIIMNRGVHWFDLKFGQISGT